MFIRVKQIKNKKGKVYPYAYLVDNKWYKRGSKNKGKGSRQKVVKYLGRVYSFSKINDIGFFEFYKIDNIDEYIEKSDKGKMLRDLVNWELNRHDIHKEDFSIDFRNKKIMKKNNEISLKLNEGLLNSYTFGRLIRFRFKGDEREEGFRLAKFFVEAGIEVPKEVFVGIFGKVYK